VEHEIKKNAMQAESPRRTVAANVRFDFNNVIFALALSVTPVFLTVPVIARQ
jgi:hypothetical protein